MNRLIALATFLVVPSTAVAAPLEPLPFQPARAQCLSATGAPGGLALLGPYSRRDSAIDLLTAGGAGATRSGRVRIGRMIQCASVAEAPGGAAVLAGTTANRDYEPELRAVARDPGGAFGAPVVLSDRARSAVAGVGPAGHAVVAWSETHGRRHRILAARRAPGGPFGAAETLVEWRTEPKLPEVELAATVDGAGTATLLWTRELAAEDFDEHVEAATAAPGGAFSVQRLASGVSTGDAPSLAAAPDGWAIAAFDADAPQVFERAPGGAFQAVTLPALPGRNATRTDVAAAVREGGGAVLAWRVYGGPQVSGIEALTRAAPGGSWSRRRVAPRGPDVPSRSSEEDFAQDPFVNPFDVFARPPHDDRRRELDVSLAGDGDFVVVWTGGAGRAPLRVATAHAVLGRLDGSAGARQRLGTTLRATHDVAPLVLPDGRVAAAWTDAASSFRHGRLHLAVEGAPPRAPAGAPRVTLRAPRVQRLFALQSPRVVARCDAACDLRTIVLGPHRDSSEARASTQPGGRRARLDVDHVFRPGTVKVVVHASAPGGDAITTRSVRIRVERRRALPLLRPLGVTARRLGDETVVRWRTSSPARRQAFYVIGQNRRDRIEDPGTPGRARIVAARGRRRFAVRLGQPASGRVRWVVVVAVSIDSDAERFKLVKVRR